jgi:hypothetical protein
MAVASNRKVERDVAVPSAVVMVRSGTAMGRFWIASTQESIQSESSAGAALSG